MIWHKANDSTMKWAAKKRSLRMASDENLFNKRTKGRREEASWKRFVKIAVGRLQRNLISFKRFNRILDRVQRKARLLKRQPQTYRRHRILEYWTKLENFPVVNSELEYLVTIVSSVVSNYFRLKYLEGHLHTILIRAIIGKKMTGGLINLTCSRCRCPS